MKIKDLKELLKDVPDDTDIIIYTDYHSDDDDIDVEYQEKDEINSDDIYYNKKHKEFSFILNRGAYRDC